MTGQAWVMYSRLHPEGRQDFVTDRRSRISWGSRQGGSEENGADSNYSLPLPANQYLSTEEVLSMKRRIVEGRLGGSVGWASNFSSGHNLTVRGFEPRVRLCADSLEPGACFGFCVCLSLSFSLFHTNLYFHHHIFFPDSDFSASRPRTLVIILGPPV